MAEPIYPKGAEWRKWDLHIHAPTSALNNQFSGTTNAEKWENYIQALEQIDDVAVLGITDYFSAEGYLTLREHQKNGRLPKVKLLFPNVELRLLPVTDQTHPINIHVLFSPDVADRLETDFFQSLEFSYGGNSYKCTRSGLVNLGRAFRRDPQLDEGTAYTEGVMQFKVTLDILREVFKRNNALKQNAIVCVANSNQDGNSGIQHNSLAATRQEIYRESHIIFSGNPNDTKFFLGKGVDSPESVITKYGGLKPCVTGSDAHKISDLCHPHLGRHTWIKADPTFQGLKQILNEPGDRVFVGDLPSSLARVSKRQTKVAKSVKIHKIPDANTTEKWFDADVPLNAELIAVIGNKGSGKSAFSDVIGLVGNTPRFASFSFLRTDRFRHPKNNKARQFQASLTWVDGTVDSVPTLDDEPSPDAVEKVKYIPQNYLEEICNEIGLGKGSRFYAELQQVIFSHVAEAEKLGFATLDDLLNHRSEETNQAIESFIAELQDFNAEIVGLEEKLSPPYEKSLDSQLAEKRREAEAHKLTLPKEVKKPDADPTTQQQSKTAGETLEKRQGELKVLEKEIADARAADSALAKKRTSAEKLLAKLQNLERQVDNLLEETKAEFEQLGLEQKKTISVKIDVSGIEGILTATDKERASIASKLDEEQLSSLTNKRASLNAEIEKLQTELSAPQREYQVYVQSLKDWENSRDKIIGSADVVGTVRYLEKQLADLKELPKTLCILRKKRTRKTLEIYREKQKLRGYYASYYGAVQNFLSRHPLATSEQFRLTFNVSVAQNGFSESFLGRVNKRKIGPFMGEDEGGAELKRLLDATHFDSPLGTLRFANNLLQKMTNHGERRLEIKDQLRQGSAKELYDFIFSLSYLSPIYNLRWDGKGLEQLSPGERGNLLLIFYLLVDQDDIPLVIDQPEENLDNQTVFRTLVPCIKDAKRRRQIIMVTHNPNLAVVCDAEQIVYAEIHKDNLNEVVYVSGSIEDPIINRKIIDVLEGTRPAFDKRDDKYHV